MSNLFLIGTIRRPHGIKGECRVEIITDFPERFKTLKSVLLSPPEGGDFSYRTIRSVRFHKGWALLCLEGVDSRTDAEALRGYSLHVPEEERWERDENFYYLHELEGLPVVMPGGDEVGKVSGFEQGGQLLLVITTEEGHQHLIPFVREFVEVRRGDSILLHAIPGLLSLSNDES